MSRRREAVGAPTRQKVLAKSRGMTPQHTLLQNDAEREDV